MAHNINGVVVYTLYLFLLSDNMVGKTCKCEPMLLVQCDEQTLDQSWQIGRLLFFVIIKGIVYQLPLQSKFLSTDCKLKISVSYFLQIIMEIMIWI